MPVTLKDIASLSGTSVSTVSRVLNGKGQRISAATRRRVRAAAETLAYQPNPLARGLRLQQTMALGLLIPDIANPFFAHITRSIQQEAHRQGYQLMVCDTNEDLALEVEHLDLLQRQRVDGLMVMPVGQEAAHLNPLLAHQRPLVLIDRYFDTLDSHAVVLDNHKGGFMATELLIQHGHVRIGVIQGLPGVSTTMERLSGYHEALRRHGLPSDPALIAGHDFRVQSGYDATRTLLKHPDPPTALFATGDLLALGALQAIRDAGLRIPEDLSLVSFDDIEFAPVLMCPLTTIGQPWEDMGKAALQLLLEQITHPAPGPGKKIVFQPTLHERASVAAPPARPT